MIRTVDRSSRPPSTPRKASLWLVVSGLLAGGALKIQATRARCPLPGRCGLCRRPSGWQANSNWNHVSCGPPPFAACRWDSDHAHGTPPRAAGRRAPLFSLSLSLFFSTFHACSLQCTQTQPCCRLINNPVKSAVKPTPPNPFFIRIHQAYSTFLFSLASLPTALQGAGAPSVLAGSRLGRRPPSVRERDRAPPAPQHARPRCRALRALAASAAGLVAMAMAARCDGATASSQ